MDTLSFKNFRKFQNFPEIELGKITMLVGTNDSGKSTFQRGMILFARNIQMILSGQESIIHPYFHFDIEDANLCTIGQSVNIHAQEVTDSKLNFCSKIDDLFFDVEISLSDFNKNPVRYANFTKLPYSKISISCNKFKIEFNYASKQIVLSNSPLNVDDYTQESLYPSTISQYDQVPLKIKDYILRYKDGYCLVTKIPSIDMLIHYNMSDNISFLWKHLEELQAEKYQRPLKIRDRDYAHLIGVIFGNLKTHINSYISLCDISYIPAHGAIQQNLYMASDKSYVLQTIKEFYDIKSQGKLNTYKDFLKACLKIFKIHDIRCRFIYGSAYTCEICREKGKWQDLSMQGRGIIQLVILIMRFTIEVAKTSFSSIIIVEEPEQNLHPSYQSLLADLFLIAAMHKIKIVIETHSEYLIRKSQVLTANAYKSNNELNWTPKQYFKTLYFSSKGLPYDMGYLPNGKFQRKFEPGFYDIADNLIIDLI